MPKVFFTENLQRHVALPPTEAEGKTVRAVLDRVYIGVSTGGVWVTPDGGESWENPGQGMRAEYMPPGHGKHHRLALGERGPGGFLDPPGRPPAAGLRGAFLVGHRPGADITYKIRGT